MCTLYLILEGPEVAGPRVSVPIIISLLPKVPGYVPVDNRFAEDNALKERRTAERSFKPLRGKKR